MSPIPLCFSPIFYIANCQVFPDCWYAVPRTTLLGHMRHVRLLCRNISLLSIAQYSTTTCSQVQFPIKELVAMLKFCLQDIWWQCLAVILSVWRTSHY